MNASVCPSCRKRRARRACPALQRDICTVCCATKRLTEIRCPSDCRYLASAQTHPPAAVQRQHERDTRFLLPIVAVLRPRQYRLFVRVQLLLHDAARTTDPPVDDRTVRETADALAKTYDTAGKGIIYAHQAPSLAAEHLVRELKPRLDAPLEDGGARAGDRDLAAVLRCIERAASEAAAALGGGDRAYVDLVSRLAQASAAARRGRKAGDEPRIVVP